MSETVTIDGKTYGPYSQIRLMHAADLGCGFLGGDRESEIENQAILLGMSWWNTKDVRENPAELTVDAMVDWMESLSDAHLIELRTWVRKKMDAVAELAGGSGSSISQPVSGQESRGSKPERGILSSISESSEPSTPLRK